jgi:hypothetical protein
MQSQPVRYKAITPIQCYLLALTPEMPRLLAGFGMRKSEDGILSIRKFDQRNSHRVLEGSNDPLFRYVDFDKTVYLFSGIPVLAVPYFVPTSRGHAK